MREIKFRAWDKENKKMREVTCINFYDEYIYCDETASGEYTRLPIYETPLMQYTGLKDKNGVEIYEGDVFGLLGGDVERPNEYEFHAKVYFDNDFSAFCVELYNGGWEYLSDYLDNPKNEREVIGNIYENPELVK